VFTYEDLISERVARALNLKLTGEQIDRLTKRHTVNSAAYWAYLKGVFYWGKRSPEGFKKAMEYFRVRRAIKILITRSPTQASQTVTRC